MWNATSSRCWPSSLALLGLGAALLACQPAGHAPGSFNAFETSTAAGAIGGVIKTKVAAIGFDLAIVALNTAGTAVATGFTGDVRLELVNAAAGANCASYASIQNLGTHTFAAGDSGRKTRASISEANAWSNARVRISYPASSPTIVSCSSDNFAIRPASFAAVTASDADSATAGTARALNNTSASGGNVHKAGQPFRIAASAVNAAGTATSNYTGSPVATLVSCLLPATSCASGTLTAGSFSAVSGVITSTTARYSEVGALSFKLSDTSFAAVDAADGSSTAERTIESSAINLGRFVPDHFDLAPANTPQLKTFNDSACASRSFTYLGQPFGYVTAPVATITARNASGTTTANYRGSLWKLTGADVAQAYSAATGTLDTGLIGAAVVAETGNGVGTASAASSDLLAFTRSTPVAPFSAAITLSMTVTDGAESALSGNGTIATATPASFASIAFDAGAEMRFGRLRLANAHGSDLLDLPVMLETQYWNGTGFLRNAADRCTQISASQIALSNWKKNLAACETSTRISGRFASGRGNLIYGKPGAGNHGSVELTVQLGVTASGATCVAGSAGIASAAAMPWLQGAWNGAAFDANPTARASFGLNKKPGAVIFRRERY